MSLYSFSIDFRNKRYINQTEAGAVNEALQKWAKNIERKQIQHIGEKTKQQLIEDVDFHIEEELVVHVDYIKSMWTSSFLIKTGFGIVDIIQTDENPEITDADLFTFVMDFRGGTYFDQLTAGSVKQAVNKWAENLNVAEIEHLGEKSKQQLINALPDLNTNQIIKPLETAKNVWRFSFQFKTGFAVIHIVKTDALEDKEV